MIEELKQTIKKTNNIVFTENGAAGYSTSGNILVDLNFRVPGNHNNVKIDDYDMFSKSLESDPVNTIKWLFFLRDVREGLGERDSFISLFGHLVSEKEDLALKVLPLIPEFGRWKDVVDILSYFNDGSKTSDCAYNLIKTQLIEDCNNMVDGKPVSLLAKWLPSVNASFKSRKTARRICNNLSMIFADYRKMLSKLRKYIDVTEVKTCSNQWGEIDYNKVSSNANKRYLDAFIKHDEKRRNEYLQSLSSPESGSVMHAENLYPYEVYAKYRETSDGWYNSNVEKNAGIEALWNNLKNIESTGNTLVVVDGSGSMTTPINNSVRAIDVSRSLGVFFSERCSGEYKDKVIEFSSAPHYIDLSGCKSLADKYNILNNYDDCSNTDIEKVFDIVLKTAVDNKLSQSELPQQILIVSDMEFDHATVMYGDHNSIMNKYKTLFENIQERWDEFGYTLPGLVFWNVNSRTHVVPVTSNEAGVTLVSGFSVNNIKLILSGNTDPWLALKSILDSERYKVIEETLNKQ